MQPGAKHQGSVRSLLEGKEDVDIAGVELSKEQVQYRHDGRNLSVLTFSFLFNFEPLIPRSN